ncbi:hypothetical protein BBG19_1213 [Francisella sp. MA067296]|nr:hypothetical protein BBG19_1213 [Francisella sp. MA067296]
MATVCIIKTVVVIDNATFHKNKDVLQLITDASRFESN